MSAPIPANAAEKPKRGRPSIAPPAALAYLSNLFAPELAGRKDRARALRQIVAFQKGVSFAFKHELTWLADHTAMQSGGPHPARRAICAEIGLLLRAGWSEDEVLEAARQLCDEKPSTRIAVSRLRAARRRASNRPDRVGDGVELARALETTVNEFLSRCPGTPWSVVVNALEHVAAECRESEGP